MEMILNPDELFAGFSPEYLSASVSELGDNAGQITWRNCLTAAGSNYSIVAFEDSYDGLRNHFRQYGAWDDSEVNAWSERELRAMAIQEIAADYRYQTEHDNRQDEVRHNLAADGKIYAYFGI